MMDLLQLVENEQLRTDIPDFTPGDTVRVHVKVVEGNRERVQVFEGVVGKVPRRHLLCGGYHTVSG